MPAISIKRIYDEPSPGDGYRMLVDRIWPRGVKKTSAKLDEWNKQLPPSDELRKWFNHKPERFKAFEEKYRLELEKQTEELKRVKALARHQELTLLYGAKDPEMNQAVVLRAVLSGR
ncbi:MAG TPA: DUF488 domain-containing protein [Puia sp.]|nr:DUF488 domain-containing protein [Puia sp.]